MNLYEGAELTIGTLAQRTGVSTSTLRAWERKFGFPVPQRLDSGHRRYTDRDVTAVRSALRDRENGHSIGTALQRAKAVSLGPTESIFGALQHALPDVPPVVLSKRTMLVLSRAIEDEIASRANRPILIAAFQQEPFWRASEPRWQNLASTSSAAVVLAAARRRQRQGQLWQMRIDPSTPIAREWVVLCDSPTFSACLAGVELPEIAHKRRFQAIWTTEPIVVREVARVAAALTTGHDPMLDDIVGRVLQQPAASRYDAMRATTTLTNRVLTYLDRQR